MSESIPPAPRGASERFGEVRSLLQQAPTSTRWWQLVEAVEGADELELSEQLVPYIAQRLARWPAHLRECPNAWWLRGVDGPWPALELVTSVTTRSAGTEVARVLEHNPMRALRHLTLRGEATSDALAALAEAPRALQTLRLLRAPARFDAWEAWLGAAPNTLELLEVRGDEAASLGTRGLSALAQNKPLPALHTLRWTGQRSGPPAVEALARWPGLQTVRALALDHARVRLRGVEALARSPFQHVVELGLRDASLDDEAALTLIAHEGFTALRRLDLSDNPITRWGVAALERPELGRLDELDLSGLPGVRAFSTHRPATLITR